MPSIEANRSCWDDRYGWPQEGDEWSAWWGHAEAQWRWSLLPRVGSFLPASSVLEIGPGFGRWTNELKELCDRLVVVDLSGACIRACKERFSACSHIEYHVNDGRSLSMVADGSVDFAFSFDSLVHAEADVMQAYLTALAAKLTPDGVAFIHHSNAGSYRAFFRLMDRAPFLRVSDRWRARSMTASLFRDQARAAGLHCIGQELVNWGSWPLIDAMSLVTPVGSTWTTETTVVRDRGFMREAAHVREISNLYLPGHRRLE